MKYKRALTKLVKTRIKHFPVIAVTGSRQVGKTTFIREMFPRYDYYNLENLAIMDQIRQDPEHIFVSKHGIIVDEVQRFPELLSYIQTHVDESKKMGNVIISGSQNLLISEKIAQSLAGRSAYCYMYPLSLEEKKDNKLTIGDVYKSMFVGDYPAIYDRKIPPSEYYEQYLVTYIERDVRMIRNISDLAQFRKFLILLAGRVGQLVNLTSLGNDVGVSGKTIEDWLSILEASFLIFRLQPYFRNIGKRLIRSPKIFFRDTGLLCYLLGLTEYKMLKSHFAIGSIFENYIILELDKYINNHGLHAKLSFYRDNKGNEIDLLVESGSEIVPIEIKSASTYSARFVDSIEYWNKITKKESSGYVVYSGETNKNMKIGIYNWADIIDLSNEIFTGDIEYIYGKEE